MSTIADVYPLSPLQSGILYHSLREEDASVYFLQFSYRINGPLVPALVEAAFNRLLERHDILRTVFNYSDLANPVQLVLRERKIEFHFEDLRHTATEEAFEAAVQHFRKRDQARGFDLRKDVLMRVAVLQFNSQSFEVVWSFHHILMDGWCMSILTHEFLEIYNGLANSKPVSLPVVTPYKKYIQWLEAKDRNTVLAYWKKYLSGFEQGTPLLRTTLQPVHEFELNEEWLVLDEQFTAQAEQLAAQMQVTVNALVQAAWGLLLGYYNDSSDVVFGTIVSGRPADIPGIEAMIGLFINAIPVRATCTEGLTFAALAGEIHKAGVESTNYAHCQLADIQAASEAGNQLIDHLLVFENYPIKDQIEGIASSHSDEQDSERLDVPSVNIFERSNYNFSLVIVPGSKLHFKFRYNRFAYDREWVERLRGHFHEILKQVVSDPSIAVQEVNPLTAAETEWLLQKGAGEQVALPEAETVVSLFELRVAEYPARPALVWNEGTLAYSELDHKANVIAQALIRTHGVQPGDRIALMMERSHWAIISILAIMKTGAVYLPVDPAYPQDRITNILSQAAVNMMLTDSETMFRAMEFYSGALLAPDIQFEELEQDVPAPGVPIQPGDISYIIFTSGSTGTPNGVMIPHRGQVNMHRSQTERFALVPGDKVLQFASLSFDASVWEMSMALLTGAALVLVKKSIADDAASFAAYLQEKEVTIVTLPPVYLNVVDITAVPSLRIVITAGEEARPEDAARYSKRLTYFNAYGPSEYSVCISAYRGGGEENIMTRVPVGTPFFNTRIYLLDAAQRLVPGGMAGEICVSGAGLAKGYINNPQLTGRRFIANPFIPGELLYRTGDRGRWVSSNNLEFLGRRDEQVKIRGHRVETGEVAAALLSLSDVNDVFVLAGKEENNGTGFLTAYYTGNAAPEQLRKELEAKLPGYMVPAFLIPMEQLPLNTNGKVDKKALPVPGIQQPAEDDLFSEREQQMAAIWLEVLGMPVHRKTDNFFTLGGHSLKVIQVSSRVMKQYGVRLEIKDVFDHPTLAELSLLVEQMQSEEFEGIRLLPEQEYYAISHAQKRLWILAQLEKGTTAYNIPQAYRITGPLNRIAFEKAFRYMVNRHEILRTAIPAVNNEPVQKIYETEHFEPVITYTDLSAAANPLDEAVKTAGLEGSRVFDLEQGPLFFFSIMKLAEGDHVLVINFHHVIADGWSMTIFVKEIIGAYHAFCEGMQPSSEPLRIQYKEYAAWQQAQLSGTKLKEYRKFWMDMYRDKVPVLHLPSDHRRPEQKTYRGGWHAFQLDAGMADGLQQLAREKDVTLFMLMRAALQTLLAAYTGQTDMVIGSPVASRDHVDLEPVIGFFVNMMPVRIQAVETESFETLLEKVKNEMLKVFKYQVYPFDRLVEDLNITQQPGRSPLFDVMMVVQSHNDTAETDAMPLLGAGTQITELNAGYNVSKYDLTFTFIPGAGSLSVSIEYSLDLFEQPRIGLLAEYLKNTFAAILGNPGATLHELHTQIMGRIPAKSTRKDISFDFTG